MEQEKMPKWAFYALLVEKYGCVNLGKKMAPAYGRDDDMPIWFRAKGGLEFPVHEPVYVAGYTESEIERVMEAGKLEVVVSLHATKAPTGTTE